MKLKGMKMLLWMVVLLAGGIAFHLMGQTTNSAECPSYHQATRPQYPEGIEPKMIPRTFWAPDSDSGDIPVQ